MRVDLESDGLRLEAYLARPAGPQHGSCPGLLICHGFPSVVNGSTRAGESYHELADRIAEKLQWTALALTYRGCGGSEGDFSLGGWLADLRTGLGYLRSNEGPRSLWVAGFGTGGALAICAAADDDSIAGVAAVAPPADFDDWAQDPEGLLAFARRANAIRREDFPDDLDQWVKELGELRALKSAERLAPRPLLVLHGAIDAVVPTFDARLIADAHGSADLRILEGAGHRLRFDPRAIAILLGWLDRQG